MTGSGGKHGFMDVDSQDDPGTWVRCLDTLQREPFYAAYKKCVRELLDPRPGGRYLDVGAGTGDDAREAAASAQATVVALDHSRTMIAEALHRGLATGVVGCARSLPFGDAVFDGCWADRTLQHVLDPQRVLAEMVRVTRPAGRVVGVDPDYDTQVMEFPDQVLARRVLRYRAERALRNGALAHRMPGIFSELGLFRVQAEAMTLIVRDHTAVDNVMGLRTWAGTAQSEGYLSGEDVSRWERLFSETVTAGRFLWAVTFFLTAGMKPE
jgi:SAM-dependent methyltransferase